MKINSKNKFLNNAKITDGYCLRCKNSFKAHRYDKKYCSDLCRVQDGIERRENGFVKLVFRGTKIELEHFFNERIKHGQNTFLLSLIRVFDNTKHDINEIIKSNESNKSWFMETNDFRIDHIAHNKKKPFELYFSLKKYDDWFRISEMPKIISLKSKNKRNNHHISKN